MTTLLDKPNDTPLGRKNLLKNFSQKTDDEIAKMSPQEIKEVFEKGADLDANGNPKQKDSSLRIHIELDLEVEVHLSARVQGDVTIGLL